MKKKIKASFLIPALLIIALCVFVYGESKPSNKSSNDPWSNATYTKDKTFGNGSTSFQVEVVVEDHSVTFTINTDKATVGDALIEHNLIAGDAGEFGLYVKEVNGITADYDVDQHYWGFNQNGEMMMVGVDGEPVTAGSHYELVYSK